MDNFRAVYNEINFQNGMTLNRVFKAFPQIEPSELTSILSKHQELGSIYKDGVWFRVVELDRLHVQAINEYREFVNQKISSAPLSVVLEFLNRVRWTPEWLDVSAALYAYNNSRDELGTMVTRLRRVADEVSQRLDENREIGYLGLNSSGELQGNGSAFDVACARTMIFHQQFVSALFHQTPENKAKLIEFIESTK